MNLIKQIVKPGEYGTQTIKMIVRPNERGPRGEQGEKGDAATITAGNAYSVEEGQSPAVINTGTSSDAVFDFYLPKGPKGDDGAIQYTAGTGINITSENVIEATGDATAAWGGIQGDIANQTDLQNELANFAEIGTTLSTPTDVAYVSNNNIQTGAVTSDKFAQYAVNNAVRTSNGLTPAGDTPSDWINLFGTPGYYVTGLSGKHFTEQPTNYGVLETIFRTDNSIMQRYTSTVNDVYIRTGDTNGWHGATSRSSFAQVFDSTSFNPCLYQIGRKSTDLTTAFSPVAIPDSQVTFDVVPGAYYKIEVDLSFVFPSVTTDELDMSILWGSGVDSSYQVMDYSVSGNTAGSGRARRASGFFIPSGNSVTVSVGVSSATVPNTITSYEGLIVVTRLR